MRFTLWRTFRLLGVHAILVGLMLALLPARANALPQNLDAAYTTSGLSVHQSFYDELAGSILEQNRERTAVYSGSAFDPYVDLINDQLDLIEDLIQEAGMAGLGILLAILTGFLLLIVELLAGLACGSTQLVIELGIPTDSVYGAFTVQDVQISQIADGQRFDLTLTNVGMISQGEVEVGIGGCTAMDREDVLFVYPSLTYQVDVTFLPSSGVQNTAQLVGLMPPIIKLFDGDEDNAADTLWSWGNETIGGADLEDKIRDFATLDVPLHLEAIFDSWWTPHLAQSSSFLVNLSGSKQNLRYAENSVSGNVGPALFGPMESDLGDHKVRVVFDNLHGAVPANPMATCAADGFDDGPGVLPNFDTEVPGAEGSYHTSYKTFEHRIAAGIRSAVGLRHEDKPGSDYIVEHLMLDIVPEAGVNSIEWLFRSPTSPIRPIPLGPAQSNALQATPVVPGLTLKQVALGGLYLRIRVCEMKRPTVACPFDLLGGDGEVHHEVMLEATVEYGTVVVLQETFEAVFQGRLRLSKVPKQDSVELRTIRSELISLENQSGLEWFDITFGTPFTDAPVSLFLRAFLGDNTLPSSIPAIDSRIHFFIEGLVGPLVERAAHGMVVLPGLDFPTFDGFQHGFIQIAQDYHHEDFVIGLDLNRPALCAEIIRWGETPAVSGVPGNYMLSLEVDWREAPDDPVGFMGTVVSASTTDAPHLPSVEANPSRWDGGYLRASYEPVDADESRVMNASGHRLGDYLPGGGEHYVAATAVGYRYLREAYPYDENKKTSIELRPYRRYVESGPLNCSELFPGPIRQTDPPHQGDHHEGSYPHVYEALTFESRMSCAGPGICDGTRVVAMWTAPLFWACPAPDGPADTDWATFDTVPGTLRVPPSSYDYLLDVCGLGGPGGGGEEN